MIEGNCEKNTLFYYVFTPQTPVASPTDQQQRKP